MNYPLDSPTDMSSTLRAQLTAIDQGAVSSAVEAAAGSPRHIEDIMHALVRLAVSASPARLDDVSTKAAMSDAKSVGATPAQILDTLAISAVIGFHTLTQAIPVLNTTFQPAPTAPATEIWTAKQAHYDHLFSSDRYWKNLSAHCPDFLKPLLHFAPQMLESFVEFAAIPWVSKSLTPQQIEMLYVAVDVAPEHQYEPGLRLHSGNAIDRGVSPLALVDVVTVSGYTRPLEALGFGIPILLSAVNQRAPDRQREESDGRTTDRENTPLWGETR